MSSRISSRPRRTRLYDAAYNIGENYYKSALDNLDRKQFGRSLETSSAAPPPLAVPRYSTLDNDLKFEEDLQNARNRAHRAITEEPYYDSRPARPSRPVIAVDDDLDDDVMTSLNRIRASRSKMNSLINELDLDDSFSKINRRSKMDLGEKLLGIAGEDNVGTSIRSRAIKTVTRGEELDHEVEPGFKSRTRKFITKLDDEDAPAVRSSSMIKSFKRTTISSNADESVEASAASMRAKATKARLADLETDMFDRSEKLLERERRSANLKKILADNDIPEMKSSFKKVTF